MVRHLNISYKYLSHIPEAPFKCTGHGKKYQSFCYVLSKSGDMKSWPEALSKCEKMGGTLAMIKDANTNKFIVNLVKKV